MTKHKLTAIASIVKNKVLKHSGPIERGVEATNLKYGMIMYTNIQKQLNTRSPVAVAKYLIMQSDADGERVL